MKRFLGKHKIALGFCCIFVVITSLIVYYEVRIITLNNGHNSALSQLSGEHSSAVDEMNMRILDITESKDELAYTLGSQLKILTIENSELTQAHIIEMLEIQQQLAEMDEEHGRLNRAYWENSHIIFALGLNCFDAPMVIHKDANMTIINLLAEHFDALFAGDEQRFRATIGVSEWSEEFLMRHFFEYKEANYYRAKVKFIPSSLWAWGHRTVFILVQRYEDSEPEFQFWPVIVSYQNGRWLVFDYH